MDAFAGLIIALVGSIVTTAVYVGIVWHFDRFEKEPVRMLALAFVWGMLPAVFASGILEVVLTDPLSTLGGEAMGSVLVEAGAAPIIEEIAKALALFAFLIFSYRELDGVLDGIVYGAMIGFGFAFTENVLYIVSGIEEKGLAVGMAILFLRTVVFGLNHALFTGMTGAAVGVARLTRGPLRRLVIITAGLLLAIAFHAIHNLGTSLAEATGFVSIIASFVADWSGVLGILLVAVAARQREQYWLKEELAGEVPLGILSAEQYNAVVTPAGRQRLLARTLRRDGWTAYRRLNRLYVLATELAFRKHQVRLMGDEQGNSRDVERLRAAIIKEQTGG